MVLNSLLTPPSIPAQILSRERLLLSLSESSGKRLTLISAEAGSGKTVLLCDFIKSAENTCWLQGDALIDDPIKFLTYLNESIRLRFDKFGEKLPEYLSSLFKLQSKISADDILLLFLNDIAENISGQILIVIDDFQLIQNSGGEWLGDIMNRLLWIAPQNMRFIISSREEPLFETAKLKAKRNISQIGTRDLAFTEEEVTELIRKYYGGISSASRTNELIDYTSGWITGIHLLLQAREAGESVDMGKLSETALFEYFAEDILGNLDEEYRMFLLQSSLLGGFSAGECTELLSTQDAARIISELLKKNIFLEISKSSTGTVYFYQKLFSEFLKKKAMQLLDNGEICDLLERSARLKAAKGDITSAIRQYKGASLDSKAAALIITRFDEFFNIEDYLQIQQWFTAYGDLHNQNIDLRLCLLRLSNKLNNISLSESCYSAIESLGGFSKDSGQYITYNLSRAELDILTGRQKDAVELLEPITNSAKSIYEKNSAKLLLARAYYRMGFAHYDRVSEILKKLLEEIAEHEDIKSKLESYTILANMYHDAGDIEAAIHFYEQTMILEKSGIKLFKTYSILAYLYSITCQFEKAYGYLETVREIYRVFPTNLIQRFLLRSAQKFHANLGDIDSAFELQRQLEDNESVKTSQQELFARAITKVELCYRAGRKEQARELLPAMENFQMQKNEHLNSIYEVAKYFYCAQDITKRETESALLGTLKFHVENKANLGVPNLELFLAEVYLLRGEFETAEHYLKKSLSAMHTKRYNSVAHQQFVLARHVFDFAISRGIEKNFIDTVRTELFSKAELPFLTPEFRAELEERNKLLIDIKMLPFGRTDFLLRGKALEEDKWTRKKSKILLAYLMADPKRVHTKDEIIDLFFGEAPADKADTMYHSTMYNIRTALKIYDIKSDAPKRSKHKPYDYNPEYILYGDKTLRLNADFYYESDNVRFEKLYEKFRLPLAAKEDRIKSAIAAAELYAGDFLPGYYESWCEELRIKYKNMFASLMSGLIELLEPENRNEEIMKYSERLLTEDSLNEAAYLAAIKAYANMQNINMAKSLLAKMLRVFDEELGEKPSSKTLRIISEIVN